MTDGDRLRRQLTQRLESLQRAGVTHVPRVRAVALPVSPPTATPTAPPAKSEESRLPAPATRPPAPRVVELSASAVSPTMSPPPAPVSVEMPRRSPLDKTSVEASTTAVGENLPLAARREAFEALCADVRKCRKCPVLVANRTQTVFGVGDLQPRLCFFGEAPGADEDEQGEPFVGKAGDLLNKMIDAMSLRREDVYILNVLKCRPPDNRPPLPEEAENCRPFFERQLAVLRPEFICCLGASAAQALLKTKYSIGKLRGQLLEYGTSKVMATYHPAYLFRNPSAKKQVWEDLQKLMAVMGLKRKT